jgi:SagB-type dehydrogenase family enzyme
MLHEAAQGTPDRRAACTAAENTWLEKLVPGDDGIALPSAKPDLARGFRERHSCMGYFNGRPPSLERFAAVLHYAMRPLDSDATDAPASPARILPMCAVVGVDGIRPGVYRYDPRLHQLRPIRHGPLGAELDESLLFRIFDMRRAGFCLFPVSEYEQGLERHGDRWYRIQNMLAGLVTQRAYLAANGTGLGCHAHCGYDAAKVTDLLGLTGTRLTPMIEVIVGGERTHGTYYECRI